MPDPFERHARPNSHGDDWDPRPPRSQQRAAAAVSDQTAKRAPGKKDPALCKAAHWKGPHRPALRIRQFGWSAVRGCSWGISWRSKDREPSWHCAHEEFCAGCGKVLRTSIGDSECPAFRPMTDEKRAAIKAAQAEEDARIAAARAQNRWKPRPVITGPQGYRKKRGA